MTEPKATTDSKVSNGATQAAEQVLQDLEALRSRAEAAEQARDEYLSLAQRTKADFENYQKRAARDLAVERRYALTPLALDILPALDNLDRAMGAAQQAGETGPLVQGVALVQAQFLDILRRHGITRIDAQGQPFDPNLHQAVMQQPTQDHPPSMVVQVLQHGYLIHDRVLRPTSVAVSTAPAEGEGNTAVVPSGKKPAEG
jgi:molecular chaperone GrpE